MREALDKDKPVFGVCLGAQMMATALGGEVEPSGGYQIGLKKVSVTAEGKADPGIRQYRDPTGADPPWRHLLHPRWSSEVGRRLHVAPRRDLPAYQHGIPLRPVLRLPIRTPADIGRVSSMGPRTAGRLPVPWAPIRSEEEAAANLREFAAFAPYHESQMRRLLLAFLSNAGLDGSS